MIEKLIITEITWKRFKKSIRKEFMIDQLQEDNLVKMMEEWYTRSEVMRAWINYIFSLTSEEKEELIRKYK